MSNIRIDIASEFKDKGFKQADKATTGLNDSFKSLGKTLVGVLSVQQIAAFGKASVKAFMEDEAAASRLTKTVANLGLGFEDARIRQFISDLESASGVSDDSLRPAFQSLITTTGSVAKSQALLGTALDVSAGSGENLTTVAQDLANAYIGNTRGLKKYNLGLSQAELTSMSFEEITKRLNEQFAGQNQANLDTYAGKMSLLKVAFDNMQETIGKGLLDAFSILGGDKGIGGTTTAMERFGDAVADTTRGVANLVNAFKDVRTYGSTLFDFIKSFDVTNPLGSSLSFARSMGKVKPAPFSTPMTISGSLDSQTKIEAARKKAEAEAAKRAKELLALTKKQVKAQEALNKKKKEDGILGEIAKRFDMERIQIAAALGGQINEVERLRLELMQAILDEDVKRAIILEGQLIKAEAAAQELATLLDSLDEMVGDPFADWPATIAKIQGLLKTLNIKIPIETLFAEKGLKLDQKNMTVTTLERMDVDAKYVYINGEMFDWTKKADDSGLKPGTLAHAEATLALAMAVSNDADATLAESEAALAAAEAAAAAADAANAMNDFYLAQLFASLGLDANGNPINNTTVNVNVEGTVIGENDLVEMITDNIYRIQKTGKQILLSTLEI
jgi:hypothetical protein